MVKRKQLFLGILIGLFLCGGSIVTPVFAESTDIENSRLSGNNRYTTSAAISKEGWTQASTVIIVTGSCYADALAASSLAKLKDAPILLTQKDSLNEKVITEIKRLKATQAILIGSAGVVGTGVVSQLRNLKVGITRIGGNNRYDTARKVAEMVGTNNGIIMATGLDFPDALSIAPIAGVKTIPILLSPKDSMDLGVSQFIKSKNIPISYIVGSTGVISSSIASNLPNSKRLSGANRYETNLSINKNFEKDLNFDTIYLATGSDFPDAVAGSALAAKNNAPIFLTGKYSLSSEIINFLKSKNVKHVVALGGPSVVSDKIVSDTIKSLTIHPTAVSLNKTTDTIIVGDTSTLIATLSPGDSANKNVNWKSSDTKIATVDNTGKVTAVSAGNATITATIVDGSKAASCTVTVNGTTNQQYPITIEQLPIDITIKNPDSIGNVYMDAMYKNNSQKNIVGFTATVLLKDTNEKTYLSNYDTVLPGETSPNFNTFGPKTLNKDDIQFLEYEITIANADGSETYISYDCKLKTYDINTYKTTDITNTPALTIEQLPIDIIVRNPDSIGNVYIDATYKNNSQKNIVGFTVTVLLKDTNEKTYLSNYDTVLPGETSPNFNTFGPKTLNKDDIQFLEYEITIANADGSKTYLTYDCKLKIYKQH